MVRSVIMIVSKVEAAGVPGTLLDSVEEGGAGDGAGVEGDIGADVGTGTGNRGGSGVGWGNTWEVERLGGSTVVCGGGDDVSEVDELSEEVLASFFGFLPFPLPGGGPELPVSSAGGGPELPPLSSLSGELSSLLSMGSRGTMAKKELL